MKKFFLFVPGFLLFLSLRAQVPVSKEPMHHDVLENSHLRLLDVHIPPGDTTQFHIHATPSVFLVLTDANTGSQVIQEEDHSKSPVPHYGNIWFEGFYQLPRIHRVWNGDKKEFHVMDIELPNMNYVVLDSPIRKEEFTFLFEEKPVRAYRLKLAPYQTMNIDPRKADILMIRLSDAVNAVSVNDKLLIQKGDFLYIASGQSVRIKNTGSANSVFVFFELK
jgi:hypothetical protein